METVTADLKGVGGLTVIGCERVCEVEKRLTGRASHGESELATQLGREVGARLVVTGGYQRLGDVVRITARVTDVESGAVLTTVKVDGALTDLFSLQDRVCGLSTDLPRAERPGRVIDAYRRFSGDSSACGRSRSRWTAPFC
jgi:TolB-like protein